MLVNNICPSQSGASRPEHHPTSLIGACFHASKTIVHIPLPLFRIPTELACWEPQVLAIPNPTAPLDFSFAARRRVTWTATFTS